MLSKVEAGLEFNQLLLKPEAKNFTQVATVECRGECVHRALLTLLKCILCCEVISQFSTPPPCRLLTRSGEQMLSAYQSTGLGQSHSPHFPWTAESAQVLGHAAFI